jgi:hypothetical protein
MKKNISKIAISLVMFCFSVNATTGNRTPPDLTTPLNRVSFASIRESLRGDLQTLANAGSAEARTILSGLNEQPTRPTIPAINGAIALLIRNARQLLQPQTSQAPQRAAEEDRRRREEAAQRRAQRPIAPIPQQRADAQREIGQLDINAALDQIDARLGQRMRIGGDDVHYADAVVEPNFLTLFNFLQTVVDPLTDAEIQTEFNQIISARLLPAEIATINRDLQGMRDDAALTIRRLFVQIYELARRLGNADATAALIHALQDNINDRRGAGCFQGYRNRIIETLTALRNFNRARWNDFIANRDRRQVMARQPAHAAAPAQGEAAEPAFVPASPPQAQRQEVAWASVEPSSISRLDGPWMRAYEAYKQDRESTIDSSPARKEFLREQVLEILESGGQGLPARIQELIKANTHYLALNVKGIIDFFQNDNFILNFFDEPVREIVLEKLVFAFQAKNGAEISIGGLLDIERDNSLFLPQVSVSDALEYVQSEVLQDSVLEGEDLYLVRHFLNELPAAVRSYNDFCRKLEAYLTSIHTQMWSYLGNSKPNSPTRTLGDAIDLYMIQLDMTAEHANPSACWIQNADDRSPLSVTPNSDLAPGLLFLSKIFTINGNSYEPRVDINWDMFFKDEAEHPLHIDFNTEAVAFGIKYENLKSIFEELGQDQSRKAFIRQFAFDYYSYLYDSSLFKMENWGRAHRDLKTLRLPALQDDEKFNAANASRYAIDEPTVKARVSLQNLGLASSSVNYFPGWTGAPAANDRMDALLLKLYSFILTPNDQRFRVMTQTEIADAFSRARNQNIAHHVWRAIEDQQFGSLHIYLNNVADYAHAKCTALQAFTGPRKILSGKGDGPSNRYQNTVYVQYHANGAVTRTPTPGVLSDYFAAVAHELNAVFATFESKLPQTGDILNAENRKTREILAAALGGIGTGCFHCDGGISTGTALAIDTLGKAFDANPISKLFYRAVRNVFNEVFQYRTDAGEVITEKEMSEKGAYYLLEGLFGLPRRYDTTYAQVSANLLHNHLRHDNKYSAMGISEPTINHLSTLYESWDEARDLYQTLIKEAMNTENFLKHMIELADFSTAAKRFLADSFGIRDIPNIELLVLPEDEAAINSGETTLIEANNKLKKQLAYLMLKRNGILVSR